MGTAVDDVHHRDREDVRVGSADPRVQRLACIRCRRLRRGKRAAENRVRAEPPLVRRAVRLDENPVDLRLIGGIHPGKRGRELAVHVAHRLRHALAVPRVSSVAELDGFELPRGRARRNCGPPESARIELDVDLDGRVPPRVEDLPALDPRDLAHAPPLARSK